MSKIIVILLVLGAFSPSTIFCQKKNRISIQTGLFHSYFDESPLINLNYLDKNNKPFNGLFYNSVGIQYLRVLQKENAFIVSYNFYYETYINVFNNLLKNRLWKRDYQTLNLLYAKNRMLNEKINLIVGLGISYRHGIENIVVNYGYFPFIESYEPLLETRIVNDAGIKTQFGFEYSPKKWLTISTTFDFISFLYLNNKSVFEKLQNFYDYKKYPHRFDLSLRFGIGFNF